MEDQDYNMDQIKELISQSCALMSDISKSLSEQNEILKEDLNELKRNHNRDILYRLAREAGLDISKFYTFTMQDIVYLSRVDYQDSHEVETRYSIYSGYPDKYILVRTTDDDSNAQCGGYVDIHYFVDTRDGLQWINGSGLVDSIFLYYDEGCLINSREDWYVVHIDKACFTETAFITLSHRLDNTSDYTLYKISTNNIVCDMLLQEKVKDRIKMLPNIIGSSPIEVINLTGSSYVIK